MGKTIECFIDYDLDKNRLLSKFSKKRTSTEVIIKIVGIGR